MHFSHFYFASGTFQFGTVSKGSLSLVFFSDTSKLNARIIKSHSSAFRLPFIQSPFSSPLLPSPIPKKGSSSHHRKPHWTTQEPPFSVRTL